MQLVIVFAIDYFVRFDSIKQWFERVMEKKVKMWNDMSKKNKPVLVTKMRTIQIYEGEN